MLENVHEVPFEAAEDDGTDHEEDQSDSNGPGEKRRGDCPDDIVARQIREAAVQEKDAVLQKKLWKEYDDYKNATCAKRRSHGKKLPATATGDTAEKKDP